MGISQQAILRALKAPPGGANLNSDAYHVLQRLPWCHYEEQRNGEGLDEVPRTPAHQYSQPWQPGAVPAAILTQQAHYRVWISKCAQDHHGTGYVGQVLSLLWASASWSKHDRDELCDL